jgi:formate--tetrahydrofolate ligase
MPLREKVETIAREIHGASGVDFTPGAAKKLADYEALGYGCFPICMAKAQYSLSADAALKGRPTGFALPIRDVRLSAGAGFVTPLCGDMRTMPGLPSKPAGNAIDIDANGDVVGLF